MLTEYSCGCWGLDAEDDREAVIIAPCDGVHAYSISVRDMSRMTSVKRGQNSFTARQLLNEIAQLFHDGYRYRVLRSALAETVNDDPRRPGNTILKPIRKKHEGALPASCRYSESSQTSGGKD